MCACPGSTPGVSVFPTNSTWNYNNSMIPGAASSAKSTALPFHDVSGSDSVFNASAVSLVSTFGQPLDTSSITDLYHHLSPKANSHPHPYSNPLTNLLYSTLIVEVSCRRSTTSRLIAAAHSPHLIAICETWLDKTISDDELLIPDFSLIHRDRDRHGGGIAVFIHECLSFSVRLTHPSVELLLVDIKSKHSRLSYGLHYRPPSADPSDLASLETTLPPLCANSLLVMGDLNVDLLSSSH